MMLYPADRVGRRKPSTHIGSLDGTRNWAILLTSCENTSLHPCPQHDPPYAPPVHPEYVRATTIGKRNSKKTRRTCRRYGEDPGRRGRDAGQQVPPHLRRNLYPFAKQIRRLPAARLESRTLLRAMDEAEEQAAARIQAVHRGRLARFSADRRRRSLVRREATARWEREQAVIKIQVNNL